MTGRIGVDLSLEFIGLRETIEQAMGYISVGEGMLVVGLGPENISLPPPTTFAQTELSLLGS